MSTQHINWEELSIRLGLKGGSCGSLAFQRRSEAQRMRLHGDATPSPEDIDRALRADRTPAEHGPVWDPGHPLPDDETAYLIAGNYHCLAAGVQGLHILGPSAKWKDHHVFLQLIAQAQSALRVVLRRAGVLRPDPDQELVFNWLKTIAKDKQVKIHRYMELQNEADPRDHESLTTRLYEYTPIVKKTRSYWWDRLRTAASAIKDGGPCRDWAIVAIMVQNMVSLGGIAPNNPDLIAALRPLKEHRAGIDEAFPRVFGPPPAEFEAAARAAWDMPENNETPVGAPSAPKALRPDAARVAAALRDKVVLFIGGEVNEESRRRLERDLGLHELRWLPTRKHKTSPSELEPDVARPEVALVVFLTGFSDHALVEVRRICDRHGKPPVLMPSAAGYGIDRLAREIITQAGKALGINGGR